MPTNVSVENNFIGGLKTEFTGLNFPENACTSATNCVFSIIGDVLRREGIDFEANFHLSSINTANLAVNYYKWFNAGGDGSTQLIVLQVGSTLYFFRSSAATAGSPVSAQILATSVNIAQFQAAGNVSTVSTTECQFTDGNGYLFVFHPACDPFYVQYTGTGPAVTASAITLMIRDFNGIIPEPGNPATSHRPTTLIDEHNYNLQNQGWTNSSTWSTSSTTPNLFFQTPGAQADLLNFNSTPVSETFTVAAGLVVTLGTQVNIGWSVPVTYQSPGDGNYNTTLTGTAVGNVTAYSGTSMTINVTSSTISGAGGSLVSHGSQSFTIASSNLINTINTWFSQIGNYPSNSDIWFEYITPPGSTATTTAGTTTTVGVPGVFNPANTIAIVPLAVAQAPQGHFLINPFNQDRAGVSGITSLTPIKTSNRPSNGCWFQGRIWYTGVSDVQLPTGDAPFYTWTENIYFSQIVTTVADFGTCFQENDPTDNRLFDLLPTDGGVIVIQGSGPIYKLFPIQNGLLVFAANGIWLIRGNSGLGFTANDYSINKISAVKSISSSSYVDVLGLPIFWNNEGIYRVSPSQNNAPYGFGGLDVEPLTVGTILSFYNNIPFDSKRFARGTYDPISYVLTWVYRSTEEAGISNRYKFDSALNLNIFNRAFYPYAITAGPNNFVCGILYLDYPTGSLSPTVKYLTTSTTNFTFSEEIDGTNWVDWHSFDNIGVNYTSSFTTGYKIHGQGFRRFQPIYVNVYSKNIVPNPTSFYIAENGVDPYVSEDGTAHYITQASGTLPTSGYTIQGIWDYANSTATGKITSRQVIGNPIINRSLVSGINWPDTSEFDNVIRRHRLPGHGSVLQMEFTNLPGLPFHILGWAIPEQINTSA
jgi:hypothetical protein